MRDAVELEHMRRQALAAWEAIEDGEAYGWEPDRATVALVDAYAYEVGKGFDVLADDLSALVGAAVEVGHSENGGEDWAVPVFASTEDDRYALADASMRGWQYWLGVQLVQDRNGLGVQ